MKSVLWKIENSRDMSLEALKNMTKNGLESMVGAVEKIMNVERIHRLNFERLNFERPNFVRPNFE
jgi:hypothetical protein